MEKRKLYLINPRSSGTDMYHVDLVPSAVGIADAALVTVAALAPADKFEIRICDEVVEDVDLDYPADYVGFTGKFGQGPRMCELASRFRQRNVPVIFGGPHASLAPDDMRPHCDVLVRGELEPIAERFFDDLYRGTVAREYVGVRESLAASPVPRWDLYPNTRTLVGALQTSRGCPFECEFCDVIVYLGRKQRHKDVAQVLRELDTLYSLGYRQVFLADDNLTVYRKRAKDLLRALAAWNSGVDEPVSFATQLSIEVSDDEEILELLRAAGLECVYIGIESSNEDALKETKKRQNVGLDLVECTDRFSRHGLMVFAGLIAGFDSDGPDIFQRHLEFADRTAIPIFHVAPLIAPHGTELRRRMAAEGRLRPDERSGDRYVKVLPSNIVPARMTEQDLARGIHWLVRELYAPERFKRRVFKMIDSMPHVPNARAQVDSRRITVEASLAAQRYLRGNPDSWAAYREILTAGAAKPAVRGAVGNALFTWAQRLKHLEEWDRELGAPLRSAANRASTLESL